MTFTIKGEATFEADSIDNAFLELSQYFYDLAEKGLETDSIFTSGDIKIKGDGKGR